MKTLTLATCFCLINLLILVSCSANSGKKETSTPTARKNPGLRIAIPQGSGEIFVNYKIFELKSDSLFVMNRIIQVGHDNIDSLYRFDTIERYKINPEQILKLETLIEAVDTLGNHHPKGYFLPMGWPRFSIQASIRGKSINGSISNCYRENHFKLLDWMNEIYPKGPILPYNEEELIKLEMELAK